MSIDTTLGLRAHTRPIDPIASAVALLDHLDAPGFFWSRAGLAFVATGPALAIPTGDVTAVLAGIEHTDEIGRYGSGPVAYGALPFAATAAGRLRIPTTVIGFDADGAWRTDLAGLGPADSAADDAEPFPTKTTPRSHWDAIVRRALAEIDAGSLTKIVLARALAVDGAVERRTMLQHLVEQQPDCFVFADGAFVGATPELLATRDGRAVHAQPMAGTVTLDAVERLRHSDKDAREHRIVIDAIVHTLAPWCETIDAPSTPQIRRFADYAHLVTPIDATLRADASPTALDLVLALHPTPAVAGTPTATACRLIDELEDFDRGQYTGPVGFVDTRGDGEFAVAVRSARLTPNGAQAYAGAGIVAGSEPAAEWAETDAKLAVVLAALAAARITR
jgi:menaquinone-specific isochorismate synthase